MVWSIRSGSRAFGGLPSGQRANIEARLFGFLRAWVFGIWLLKIATAPFSSLAELPLSIFGPLSLLRVVPPEAWSWLLRSDILTGFQLFLCLCVTLAMLGVRPYRPLALLTSLMLTFQQGLIRSFGHVNHPEVALLLVTYVLAIFPAADGFGWRPRYAEPQASAVYRAPIILMAALLLVPYTASAAYRMAHHGLTTLTGEPLVWFTVRNSFTYGQGLTGTFLLQHPIIAQLLQCSVPVATVFEWAAPLALISHYFRWLWLAFAFMFHVIIGFMMHVFFWESFLLALALLPVLDRVTTTVTLPSTHVDLR